MNVYIVTVNNEIMSVCGDKQTAEWDRNLFEMEGHKNVEIKECGVVIYDKKFYDRQMDEVILRKRPLIKEFTKAIFRSGE